VPVFEHVRLTIPAMLDTSPLGKLLPPWRHWSGSSVWEGRRRPKTGFATFAISEATAIESIDCQADFPVRVSPPSQTARPVVAAIEP